MHAYALNHFAGEAEAGLSDSMSTSLNSYQESERGYITGARLPLTEYLTISPRHSSNYHSFFPCIPSYPNIKQLFPRDKMKSAYLLTVLASAVSASTFLQFPKTISCVASNSVVNFDTAQLENAAAKGIADGTVSEEDPFGVSDEATSHCNTFDGDHKVPLYENPLYIVSSRLISPRREYLRVI